jgi:hypothetical protein
MEQKVARKEHKSPPPHPKKGNKKRRRQREQGTKGKTSVRTVVTGTLEVAEDRSSTGLIRNRYKRKSK